MRKRILSLLLLLALCLGLTVPASAAGSKPTIKQVEAGVPAVLAVLSNGDVYAWGNNRLGLVDRSATDGGYGWKPVLTPRKILSGVKKVAVPHAAGYFNMGNLADIPSSQMGNFILYIKENGELWGMGDNSVYQLGQGYSGGYLDNKNFFTWDTSAVKIMDSVKDVACNGNGGCAITTNGDLYFWGMLIAASTTGGANNFYTTYVTPTKILSNVKKVDMGEDHILALKEDGTLWGMGCQDDGTLGNGKDLSNSTDALQNSMVQLMSGCTDMAAGDHCSYAVKSNGDLYAWGNNSMNKLGVSYKQTSLVTTPMKIDSGVKMVAAANWNAYYVKQDNSVWSTGHTDYGRRGFYVYEGSEYYPLKGQVTISGEIRDITTNGVATLILKTDGTMWGFGSTYSLGTGVERYTNPAKKYNSTFDWSDVPYIWDPILCGLSAGSFAGQFGAPFKDVADSAYFYDAVEWAVNEGITSGTSTTTFSPYQTCTRAQIITFLWRAAGSPEAQNLYGTWDVTADKYYFKAVQWAAEQNMIERFGNFEPNAPCTRLAAVEFMWKYAGQPKASSAQFADVDSDAVNWAVKEGITSGTTATTFSPDNTCTRGQIVTFLYRAFAE